MGPPTEVGFHFLDIPVSVGCETCMTRNLWLRDLPGWLNLEKKKKTFICKIHWSTRLYECELNLLL